jgi:hypothetical protein
VWVVSSSKSILLIGVILLTQYSYTFYFFAGINVCLAIFVFFFIPETRRVSIEEMDVLFGGSNHVEKGGDILHIEDPHNAHVGVDNVVGAADHDEIRGDGVEPVTETRYQNDAKV